MNINCNVAPSENITLKFADGVEKHCIFNNYAMYILDTEFEGSLKVIFNAMNKIYESTAKMIYAGIKAYNFMNNINEDVSFDEVLRIVVYMSQDDVMNIISAFMKTMPQAEGKNIDLKNVDPQLIKILQETLMK